MTIPVFIVCGFLGTHKTSCIDVLMKSRRFSKIHYISFEEGRYILKGHNYTYYKSPTISNLGNTIQELIHLHQCREIWVEWNTMYSLQDLEKLFLGLPLANSCHIERIIYTIDYSFYNFFLRGLQQLHMPFIEIADHILVTHASNEEFYSIQKGLDKIKHPSNIHLWNPNNQLLLRTIVSKPRLSISKKIMYISSFILGLMSLYLFYSYHSLLNIQNFFISTSAIILQMMPFILVGVLLSAAISTLVPQKKLEAWLGGHIIKGYIVSLCSALCIPLCDCSTVPLLRSLISRNVPIQVSIFFTLISPLLNPISLLATYYAFNSNIHFVLWRSILGIILALIVSLSFRNASKSSILTPILSLSRTSFANSKSELFMIHVKDELLKILPYILLGACVSTLFQMNSQLFLLSPELFTHVSLSIVSMELLAFILSICSSSDAIIGKILGAYFPIAATIGFLLLGPMMDIKNFMLYSALFSKRFTITLTLRIFLFCFMIAMVVHYIGGPIL